MSGKSQNWPDHRSLTFELKYLLHGNKYNVFETLYGQILLDLTELRYLDLTEIKRSNLN